MPLYVPTSPLTRHHSAKTVQKGELYNLDLDQKIGFQFNPEEFAWSIPVVWSEDNWTGQPSSDFGYLGTGEVSFSLNLPFIADPTAPTMNFQTSFMAMPKLVVDPDLVANILTGWLYPLPSTGRPSAIKVVYGPRVFTGIIVGEVEFRLQRVFADLSGRQGLFTIPFRGWESVL